MTATQPLPDHGRQTGVTVSSLVSPKLPHLGALPEPIMVQRTDNVNLLYKGKIHNVFGEPEAGKGWFALEACRQIIVAGGSVFYMDYEDDETTVGHRLRSLGLDVEGIWAKQFYYIHPEVKITDENWAEYIEPVVGSRDLCVIDGVSSAWSMQGYDTNSNSDAPKFLNDIPGRVKKLQVAAMCIDHPSKGGAQSRYALGAGQKLGLVDVSYRLDIHQPFGRGKHGSSKLYIAKERGGYLRGITTHGDLADVHFEGTASGDIEVRIAPPVLPTRQKFVPTRLMDELEQYIRAVPGLGQNELLRSVNGKQEYKITALSLLVEDDRVKLVVNGQKHAYYAVTPLPSPMDAGPEMVGKRSGNGNGSIDVLF